MVRAHILFRGTVQGIGFRYTCLSIAEHLSLTGWVKNLPDGSVQAIAEGPRENIEDLLVQLKQQFDSFIKEQNIEWLEARGEFSQFEIH